MTHQLIASPYPEGHLVVRPGYDGAIRIGAARYAELRDAPPNANLPSWLADAARAGWGIDLAGRPAAGTVMVRPETTYGYARASYELNLGCNYDCEHCYLGEKLFAGMDWPGRERLLQVMADAGELADGGLRVAVVERDLVGGECSYWACIPSKTLLRPGEAVHGAREAAATARVDVQEALAYRDVMVSDYSDAGQQQFLAGKGIDPIRGTGRLAGPGVVEVDGVPHTARHVVVATGSDPVIPPVPGLHELDGIWTNREVTGMKAVPRRLLILGGGPVGAEMAQAVRRLGGEVALAEGAGHVLAREPEPLGQALGEVLRADGAELFLGRHATAARRDGVDYVLTLDDGRELRGDHLLLATGRRPRMPAGLGSVGVTAGPHGIGVDASLRAGERLWAIGDVTGIRLLTHVGKYQGEVVAANILGEPREAHYEAIPDVVYTDPQAAAVGATEAAFSATVQVSAVAKTATYTHAYAKSNGFLTLLSDGDRLTGAYALGPEAGEWLQQATLAIRARVPLPVLRDVIQPFPTFSEIYVAALKALRGQITAAREPATEGSR